MKIKVKDLKKMVRESIQKEIGPRPGTRGGPGPNVFDSGKEDLMRSMEVLKHSGMSFGEFMGVMADEIEDAKKEAILKVVLKGMDPETLSHILGVER